jgi:16S rRNA (guanine527-N7)-methyltransferase
VEHEIRSLSLKEKELVESLFRKNKIELEAYADLLIWWNDKLNLVSRGVSRETVLSHIKHSLYVGLSKAFVATDRLIDTGAGGGLPGLPLAICFPEKEIVINDIVRKKIFAVNDVINKLSLKGRAKGMAGDIKSLEFDDVEVVITKHAFKIHELIELISGKKWKRIVFLKGYEEALQEVRGLEGKIKMKIIKLDSDFMSSFYDGKGLIEIERVSDE